MKLFALIFAPAPISAELRQSARWAKMANMMNLPACDAVRCRLAVLRRSGEDIQSKRSTLSADAVYCFSNRLDGICLVSLVTAEVALEVASPSAGKRPIPVGSQVKRTQLFPLPC